MLTPSPAGRIAESIVRRFEGLAGTRDRALGEGRQITRLAANSVRATHRPKWISRDPAFTSSNFAPSTTPCSINSQISL